MLGIPFEVSSHNNFPYPCLDKPSVSHLLLQTQSHRPFLTGQRLETGHELSSSETLLRAFAIGMKGKRLSLSTWLVLWYLGLRAMGHHVLPWELKDIKRTRHNVERNRGKKRREPMTWVHNDLPLPDISKAQLCFLPCSWVYEIMFFCKNIFLYVLHELVFVTWNQMS